MMEDERVENEELTSTMGNILPTTNKDDTSDSTPTSSTDASTSIATTQIAVDDPISSTSSEVEVKDKTDNNEFESELIEINSPLSEKLSENVEDIVQDLENLLGEPTTSYITTNRIAKKIDEKGHALLDKAISMDYDEFSNEFNFSETKSEKSEDQEIADTSSKTENEFEIETQEQKESTKPEIEITESTDNKQSEEISSTQKRSEEVIVEPEKLVVEESQETTEEVVENCKEIVAKNEETVNGSEEIQEIVDVLVKKCDEIENEKIEKIIENETKQTNEVNGEEKIQQSEVIDTMEEQKNEKPIEIVEEQITEKPMEIVKEQKNEELMEIVEEIQTAKISDKIEEKINKENTDEPEETTVASVQEINDLDPEQNNEVIENKSETDNISVENIKINQINDENPKEMEIVPKNVQVIEEQQEIENIEAEPLENRCEEQTDKVEEIIENSTEIVKELVNNLDETLLAVANLQNINKIKEYCGNEQVYENSEKTGNEPLIEKNVEVTEKIEETIEEVKEKSKETNKEIMENQDVSIREEISELPIAEAINKESKEVVKEETSEIVEKVQETPITQELIINVDNFEKEKSYSPKITIKPIKEPTEPEMDEKDLNKGSLKITITKQSDNTHSILKIYNPNEEIINMNKEEEIEERQPIPKLIIKPIPSPTTTKIYNSPSGSSSSGTQQRSASPRITIKPIIKPMNENTERCVSPLKITIKQEQKHSPKLTIKPIIKPQSDELEHTSPRITIKPIMKPINDLSEINEQKGPKITIKPIIKPQENEFKDEEEERERIVLKINKGTIPVQQQMRKRDFPDEEKLPIKLKFSKESGNLQIIQDDDSKKLKVDHEPIQNHSKLKEILTQYEQSTSSNQENLNLVEDFVMNKSSSPIVISEDSNQSSCILIEDSKEAPIVNDLIGFHVTTQENIPEVVVQPQEEVVVPVVVPTPRKRGRPRKVPLEVREDFKDPKEEEIKPLESSRPKRSCRGQSVRATLGIKPRKPRGPGRGRGSKRNMSDRDYTPNKPAKEPKLSAAKLRRLKETLIEREYEENFLKTPTIIIDRADIVMYEEETRMSADISANTSRAQTPAKQVVTSTPLIDVDESQSSFQSTATTESTKDKRKGVPRLEVHQEPEGAVISADQLAEYYWSGGGPFMLQEQVAQFLGIKSFKRKYPNIQRRFVDMQERDFIRESGLACEAMCDLGLTAVNSADILDIMYSDFQDKYEEYCKHQRDRQAKDLTNKQKALSLTISQEKTKMDIMQQAVQSSANWNSNFNKLRNDQRKACMDLQTLTIHYPKGKIKQINRVKLGHYPVALVPGQFTDYYKEFTPDEINNLPLNTLCYGHVNASLHEDMEIDSQTDGSGSESDSSSSGSDSSFSGSSDGEDCTLCKTTGKKLVV